MAMGVFDPEGVWAPSWLSHVGTGYPPKAAKAMFILVLWIDCPPVLWQIAIVAGGGMWPIVNQQKEASNALLAVTHAKRSETEQSLCLR